MASGVNVCWWVTRGDGPTERSLGQVLLIEAVSGNELTLAAPLHHTFEAQYSPELLAVSRPGGPIHYVGIEDLYLSGGYGSNILVNLALYSWVKNVESDVVSGTHIVVTGSHRCVVRDSFVHRARDYNEGGNAYGISLDGQTSDSLVENNSLAHLNIPLVMEVTGGGNVYGYNYVDSALQDSNLDWATSDIRTHCTYPHMELVEGNWIASASPEDVHGTSGWLTFFRNYMTGVHENMVHPVDGHVFTPTSNVVAMNIFGGKQLYMNMVGNVLWRQGVPGDYEGCNNAAYKLSVVTCSPYVPDPDVAATAYRHGSFDYVTNSVIWDPTNGDHDLPDSLYLDSKPAFFGDRPWLFVDPEGDPKVRSLPAKDRFDQQGQPVVLSVSDVTITEGDSGNATATFTVTLSPE